MLKKITIPLDKWVQNLIVNDGAFILSVWPKGTPEKDKKGYSLALNDLGLKAGYYRIPIKDFFDKTKGIQVPKPIGMLEASKYPFDDFGKLTAQAGNTDFINGQIFSFRMLQPVTFEVLEKNSLGENIKPVVVAPEEKEKVLQEFKEEAIKKDAINDFARKDPLIKQAKIGNYLSIAAICLTLYFILNNK